MNFLLGDALSVWQRFLSFDMYHNALVAGLGIALACGLLSVFVVHKRMAFIGEGIAHGAFGGAGLALFLGALIPPMDTPLLRVAIIAAFCVVTAVVIGRITYGGRVAEDSAIGIALVAAMAFGLVLIDLRSRFFGGYTPPLHDLLYGSILTVGGPPILGLNLEAWVALVLGLVVLLLVLAVFRRMVFFTFDEESAAVFGLPISVLYFGLLVALGVTISLAMRLVGIILCTGLLILPAATASFWSRRIELITVFSTLIALAGVVIGLFLSIWLQDVSTGPVIALTLFALFLVSYFIDKLLRRRRSRVVSNHDNHDFPAAPPGR